MPEAGDASELRFRVGLCVGRTVKIDQCGVHEKHPHTPEPHIGDAGAPASVLICEVRFPFAS
jgi:hypothetical protein